MKHFKLAVAVLYSAAMLAVGAPPVAAQPVPGAKHLPAYAAPAPSAYHGGWYGDLNGDDALTATDIVILQKYLLGLTPLDRSMSDTADLSRDGKVNAADLVLLKRAVLTDEWPEILPEPTVEPTTEIITEPATPEPTEPPTEPETPEPTEPPTDSGDFIAAPIADLLHNLPSQGTGNLIVFYVDFPDCTYSYKPSEEELNEICFGAEDPSDPNYPFDSFSAFYNRSSKGVMQLQGHAFVYTAKNNIATYQNDRDSLLKECYQALDSSFDFSVYDGDGDGDIDATLITVPGQADGDYWWPCAGPSGLGADYTNRPLRVDGKTMGHLITGNAQIESAADYSNFLSSYLHEMGHCMGLPDYYLYDSDDNEAFHGYFKTGGVELMDIDASCDFSAFSKLMLGWYGQNQIVVYDQSAGGSQTFILNDSTTQVGNCLILPYGDLDSNYMSEYIILEYVTPNDNNSNICYTRATCGEGIRAFHIYAEMGDNGWWKFFNYENGSEACGGDDDGIRLIRMVGDKEAAALNNGGYYRAGGGIFTTGDILSTNTISGFAWYDAGENESVETGYTVTIGEQANGSYTVTVTKS